MAFRGLYQHALDAKNRLSIPARFRADFSSGLVLAKEQEPCIGVWPPGQMETILERALGTLNPMTKEHRIVSRFYQGGSYDLELDAAGRVTLPPPLMKHAQLDRDAVVVGMGDHLEIWSSDRWHAHEQELDGQIEEVIERLGNPS